jgi:Kef-type K+ transport system membrane component KefB
MEEKVKIQQEENPVPFWIKLMWGIFILWGLYYLASYWFPDLVRWIESTNPDAIQWHGYP